VWDRPWAPALAGGAKRFTRAAAQGRNSAKANSDDQGQHDGIFHGGWTVFLAEKILEGVPESSKHWLLSFRKDLDDDLGSRPAVGSHSSVGSIKAWIVPAQLSNIAR
jgi:hypothetical protein